MYIWNTNDQKNLNIFIVYIFYLLGSFLLTVVFVIYQSQIPKRFFIKNKTSDTCVVFGNKYIMSQETGQKISRWS